MNGSQDDARCSHVEARVQSNVQYLPFFFTIILLLTKYLNNVQN